MSLLSEIEYQLDERFKLDSEFHKQYAYQQFAKWIVDKFGIVDKFEPERPKLSIGLVCGDCKAPWTGGHMCVGEMVIHEKA